MCAQCVCPLCVPIVCAHLSLLCHHMNIFSPKDSEQVWFGLVLCLLAKFSTNTNNMIIYYHVNLFLSVWHATRTKTGL